MLGRDGQWDGPLGGAALGGPALGLLLCRDFFSPAKRTFGGALA